jgi:ABC-type nitrate/sulfonate/bicarbonate transport system substrate-binding protein
MTAGKRSDRLALHVVGALLLAAACRAPATPAAPVATAPPTAPITSPSVLPDVPAAAAPRVVRHADVPSIALAPVYVAAERGYFAAEGLDVQVERVAGAGDAVALLGTGQFDMSAGGLSAGTFNAIQRGVDIRMVAPTSY